MSILSAFLDPKIIGTGFIGNLNIFLYYIWALFSCRYALEFFIVDPLVGLAQHILLWRRRRKYGDERVWVKDLLVAAGYSSVVPATDGRHRRPKPRYTRQELLYRYIGWPFRDPNRSRHAARWTTRRRLRQQGARPVRC